MQWDQIELKWAEMTDRVRAGYATTARRGGGISVRTSDAGTRSPAFSTPAPAVSARPPAVSARAPAEDEKVTPR